MPRCLILLISLNLLASLLATRAADAAVDKLEPRLRASLGKTNDVLVLLAEQADLRGAAGLKSKTARGAYVFSALTATAERTQAPLRAWLKSQAVPHRSFWIANALQVQADAATLLALAERPEVQRIVANSPLRVPAPIPADPAPAAAQDIAWGVARIRAPEVWALGYTGQGVVIGGQDTGYQWDHPALIRQYRGWNGTQADHNYNWHDAVHARDTHLSGTNPCGYSTPVPCADESHGTHTMGTMVGDDGLGNQIGVAPGARWIGCRNMERGWGTPATYAECFQWFLAPTDLDGNNPNPTLAPDVINNSWSCPANEGCTDPLILQLAVENVRAAGIMVIFSAGNSGSGCGSVSEVGPMYAASFAVGATDASDVIANFSSRGPAVLAGTSRLKPAVSAPGVSIRSAVPGNNYGFSSGTSMAAPHVAGVVALLISAHPQLRGEVDTLERLLEQTAVPRTATQTCGGIPGTAIPNNTYGWGRLDALAALANDDADADGLPDWWEIWRGLDLHNPADATADPDGDGATNLAEYLADTDPHDAQSVFRLTFFQLGAGFTVQFESSAYRRYTLESRGDAGNWLPVAGQTEVPGSGGLLSLTQTNLPPAAQFYRVRVGLE